MNVGIQSYTPLQASYVVFMEKTVWNVIVNCIQLNRICKWVHQSTRLMKFQRRPKLGEDIYGKEQSLPQMNHINPT